MRKPKREDSHVKPRRVLAEVKAVLRFPSAREEDLRHNPLLGCVLLCACTPNSQWEDTTGQGRTDEQWKADYGACYEKAGFKPGTNLPLNEGFPAFTKCMSERGWGLVVEAIKR